MLKQEKNVLLLIANQRVSALTAKLLAVHGFTCTPAGTFTQALTTVGNGGAQIALVDFGIEPDDGCRFAAEAKKLASGLPVVVCDSEPSVAHARRVRTSEAFDYLSCPFVVPDLVNCIRRATAVLATMRKPFVALDAYLAASGVASSASAPAVPAPAVAASEPETVAPTPEAASAPVRAAEGPTVDREALKRQELELLSSLRTRGLLDEDIEAKASGKLALPGGALSAMTALELVSEDAWERAAERVASERKAPPIDFGVFPPNEKLVRAADATVLRAYLAVPFAKLDEITLVAMPHPHDAARAAVTKAVGGECRFFTCSGLAAKRVHERVFEQRQERATA